ncbi:MAG: hypothetical protein IJF73_06340 [Clostridia bacterium]|nr:hypothetical protein [Clostridia bacterium]
MKKPIVPILLGGDLNAYGMAAAFYEAGVFPSYALGRYRLGVTAHSRFIRQVIDGRMESDEGRLALLYEVAAHHPDSAFIVLGCTDEYASFLVRSRSRLDGRFILPSPPPEALSYADKAIFARTMHERGIRVPRTVVLSEGEAVPESVPFCYPAVLKPAVSEDYWHAPFPAMRKVWFPDTRAAAEETVRRIRQAGYRGGLLLQERIPASDTDNGVLTVYCDRRARATAAVYGRVLLEEHTPRGLGNHAAILTAPPPPVSEALVAFLEEIGYRGFANFDLLADPHGGEPYVLEMNLRQGRSNQYMLAAGCNPAALILADRVAGAEPPCIYSKSEVVWHSVPLSLVEAGLPEGELLDHVRRLVAAGRSVSALGHRADLRKNLWRRLFLWEHERRIRKRAGATATP